MATDGRALPDVRIVGAALRTGVFGNATLDALPAIVDELGLRRILLVTGRASFAASGASRILQPLKEVCDLTVWSDFSPNVDVDDVVAGTRVVDAVDPDGIVAIGGGSVLDMAKLLSVTGRHTPDDIRELIRSNQVDRRTRKLVLVPTTAGSGSEATHFAVAYIDREKFSVAHPSLLPDAVVLDPALTESASSYQKATSVLDAIAQAVESRWARGATDESRAFADAALADLVPAAAAYVGGDGDASTPVMSGAHLAGRAIDISKTTGPHALSYGLTQGYGISHGHAVATTLGAFARLHAAAGETDLGPLTSLLGAATSSQLGDRLDEIATEVGLELRLGALGVPVADLADLAKSVNSERLANNPVALSENDVRRLLESCW